MSRGKVTAKSSRAIGGLLGALLSPMAVLASTHDGPLVTMVRSLADILDIEAVAQFYASNAAGAHAVDAIILFFILFQTVYSIAVHKAKLPKSASIGLGLLIYLPAVFYMAREGIMLLNNIWSLFIITVLLFAMGYRWANSMMLEADFNRWLRRGLATASGLILVLAFPFQMAKHAVAQSEASQAALDWFFASYGFLWLFAVIAIIAGIVKVGTMTRDRLQGSSNPRKDPLLKRLRKDKGDELTWRQKRQERKQAQKALKDVASSAESTLNQLKGNVDESMKRAADIVAYLRDQVKPAAEALRGPLKQYQDYKSQQKKPLGRQIVKALETQALGWQTVFRDTISQVKEIAFDQRKEDLLDKDKVFDRFSNIEEKIDEIEKKFEVLQSGTDTDVRKVRKVADDVRKQLQDFRKGHEEAFEHSLASIQPAFVRSEQFQKDLDKKVPDLESLEASFHNLREQLEGEEEEVSAKHEQLLGAIHITEDKIKRLADELRHAGPLMSAALNKTDTSSLDDAEKRIDKAIQHADELVKVLERQQESISALEAHVNAVDPKLEELDALQQRLLMVDDAVISEAQEIEFLGDYIKAVIDTSKEIVALVKANKDASWRKGEVTKALNRFFKKWDVDNKQLSGFAAAYASDIIKTITNSETKLRDDVHNRIKELEADEAAKKAAADAAKEGKALDDIAGGKV